MSTVLVTGANRGIGLQLCTQLAARGDDVIACCRTASPELAALGVRVEEGVDVSSDDSIAALASRLEGVSIDLLINNAGILRRDSLQAPDLDEMRAQLEVNAIGPLRVTLALLPLLGDGAKVGIVTSRMGSIADNTSGSMYGYRASKAAVNMVGRSLSLDLKGRGVAVVLLHPGFVRTGMTGGNGFLEADESATGLLARLDELTLETTGSFVHMSGEQLPW